MAKSNHPFSEHGDNLPRTALLASLTEMWDFGIGESLVLFRYLLHDDHQHACIRNRGISPTRDFKVWFLGKKAVDLLFFCSNEVNQTLLQLLGSLFLNYLQCVRTVWVAVKCRERWWRLLLKRWRTIQQRHGVGCRQVPRTRGRANWER